MINLSKLSRGHKLLIPYITCGDPDLKTCENLVCDMACSGADAVILGLPFSDPVAESEVITSSSIRAYNAGIDIDKLFDTVARIRARSGVYLILAIYANTAYSIGVDKFAERIKSAGVNGLIVYDVPYEEKEEFAAPCAAAGINYISQAVTGFSGRAVNAAKNAEGFLYCLPKSDVMTEKDRDLVKAVKGAADVPCVFALDNPDEIKAAAAAKICDGIVVESGVVRIIQRLGGKCADSVKEYIRALKLAIES